MYNATLDIFLAMETYKQKYNNKYRKVVKFGGRTQGKNRRIFHISVQKKAKIDKITKKSVTSIYLGKEEIRVGRTYLDILDQIYL